MTLSVSLNLISIDELFVRITINRRTLNECRKAGSRHCTVVIWLTIADWFSKRIVAVTTDLQWQRILMIRRTASDTVSLSDTVYYYSWPKQGYGALWYTLNCLSTILTNDMFCTATFRVSFVDGLQQWRRDLGEKRTRQRPPVTMNMGLHRNGKSGGDIAYGKVDCRTDWDRCLLNIDVDIAKRRTSEKAVKCATRHTQEQQAYGFASFKTKSWFVTGLCNRPLLRVLDHCKLSSSMRQIIIFRRAN